MFRCCPHRDVDIVVLPRPALAPDEDGLHLRGQPLLPRDAELYRQPRVCRHAPALAAPGEDTKLGKETRLVM